MLRPHDLHSPEHAGRLGAHVMISIDSRAAARHLHAELEWLRRLLDLQVKRLQARGVLAVAHRTFEGMVVTPEEIEARLQPGPAEPDDAVEESRAALDIAALDRDHVDDAPGILPLRHIQARFGLSRAEYLLLLLAIAPEFDADLPRVYAYLHDHFERQFATLALAEQCFGEHAELGEFHRALSAAGRLHAFRLIRIDDSRPFSPGVNRAIVAEPRIVQFVGGDASLDPQLEGTCRLTGSGGAALILDDAMTRRHERLVETVTGLAEVPWELPVFVFRGPAGCGGRRWSSEVGSALKKRTLIVDLAALSRDEGSLEQALEVALREGLLQDAVCSFGGCKAIADGDLRSSDAARIWDRAVRSFPGALVLRIEDLTAPIPDSTRGNEIIDIPLPDAPAATKIWDRLLPSRLRDEGTDPAVLAATFNLTPGRIESAISAAMSAASTRADRPKLTLPALSEAVRSQVRHRLGDNTTLVRSEHTWDDLVVAEELRLQLRELTGRYRHRDKVLREWGLGRRFGRDIGLSVLFDGPPGTGKTMAAGIVASELGLDLYQIDLSRVVSRYVGETEKNLARVFDEAERARAVLLFDEADSLFASRTQVQSANDRYANLEVNYLLQRIERFSGVAILTTNFPASLDDAFTRRLSMRISFGKPDAAARAELWRSMLSGASVPLAHIDYEQLARTFELSGGHIRNAVLRAAFIAATRERKLDHELLRIAARIELKQQGMLVVGSPHGELWGKSD